MTDVSIRVHNKKIQFCNKSYNITYIVLSTYTAEPIK